MLDTRFPRLPGDIGNPEGLGFPVLYKVVKGASPQRVVREQSRQLLVPFMDAALSLVEEGADLITTSCGFLFLFQKELEEAIPVPVFTSSLILLPELQKKYGQSNVGILTISASSLDAGFCAKTGIRPGVPLGSTEGGTEFTNAILGNRKSFNIDQCRADNIAAAKNLLKKFPDLKAFLLECTNMPPYASAIGETTGLPVYSLNTLIYDQAVNPKRSTKLS